MAFRFDMQGKTTQQQIIVAKRDAEDKLKQQETIKLKVEKKKLDVDNEKLMLVIDKDNCPEQDNIIMKQQCSYCKYYKSFSMYKGQQCIVCSYSIDYVE